MSTLVFANITKPQPPAEAVRGAAEEPSATPQISTWAQAAAALVPAEVLVAHALLIQFTTETTQSTDGAAAATTITEPKTLAWSFLGFFLVSIGLYAGAHSRRLKANKEQWDKPWDYVRMLIPGLAFIDWTMLQRSTAFDAVWPSLSEAPRMAIALFLAIGLFAAAAQLRYKVPEDTTPSQGGEGDQEPST